MSLHRNKCKLLFAKYHLSVVFFRKKYACKCINVRSFNITISQTITSVEKEEKKIAHKILSLRVKETKDNTEVASAEKIKLKKKDEIMS